MLAQVEKLKNTDFWSKFQPTGPCNSRTDSQIDLGNGALDAHARAGEDAKLCDCVWVTAATVLGED